jgi:hypothetical protein
MARQILERQFDLWVNKYLFLTSYGEAETAQVVMQFFLDNKNATGFAKMNGMNESAKCTTKQFPLLNYESYSNPEQPINLLCLSFHMMPIHHQGVATFLTLEETCGLKLIAQPVLLSYEAINAANATALVLQTTAIY